MDNKQLAQHSQDTAAATLSALNALCKAMGMAWNPTVAAENALGADYLNPTTTVYKLSAVLPAARGLVAALERAENANKQAAAAELNWDSNKLS
jgi:hypothetical protein